MQGLDNHDIDHGQYSSASVLHSSRAYVRILYGTETGTAEEVGNELDQRFRNLRINVISTTAMDEYPVKDLVKDCLKGQVFVFIVATTGDGAAPSSMTGFWRALRLRSLKSGVLKGLRFAVFGLGDSAYGDAFNACARRLFRRLKELGGEEIVELGLGDESSVGGYDMKLAPWIERLLAAVAPEHTQYQSGPPFAEVVPIFDVEGASVEKNVHCKSYLSDVGKWGETQDGSSIDRSYHRASIKSNVILTNSSALDSPREVRHIVLDVSTSPASSPLMTYKPGDVAHVLPRNDPKTVSTFFALTGLSPNMIVKSRSCPKVLNLATPCPLAQFVAANLDLTSIPRRRFLQQLATYASSTLERDKLCYLASNDGLSERYQYLVKEQRSFLGVLRDFPSARPSPDVLLSIIPRLRPRSFSIASSSLAHPGEIHICAVMMKREIVVGRKRKIKEGVCSRFWQRCQLHDLVPVRVRKGSLNFRVDRPAICIGPGTGVAPMRAFIEDISRNPNRRECLTVLFFGARRMKGDFLYEKEWNVFEKEGILTRIITAFSREIDKPRVYVQDRMEEESKIIWKALTNGGCVYVAGAAGAMPRGVTAALVKIVRKEGNLNSEIASAYVAKLRRCHRLQVECW